MNSGRCPHNVTHTSMKERCAVIGGNGYVGRHVVDALLDQDAFLPRIVDRSSAANCHELFHRGAEARLADICCPEELDAAICGCSVVIHLAGTVDTRSGVLHDERITRINFGGTLDVIAACQRQNVEALIFITSAGAVADGIWGDDERAVHGSGLASAYGRSKAKAEAHVLASHKPGQFTTACVRPQLVFGPGDPLMTEEMLFSPVPPPTVGPGLNMYTPVYVKNLAGFLAFLAHRMLAENRGACRKEHGGTVLDVGDAHIRQADFRSLLLTCRVEPVAYCAPQHLPIFVMWLIVGLSLILDMLTLGRMSLRQSKLLGLTPAALYFMAGANFALGLSAYRITGYTPPYSWPGGVAEDVQKYVASVSATRRGTASIPPDGHGGSHQQSGDDAAAKARPAPMEPIFSPYSLRGLTLRNRIHKEATFEASCSADGVPSENLLAFHEAHAASGVGLTTVAYGAVSPAARTFATQLIMREAAREKLTMLTKRVRAQGGASMVQLSHAGSFSDRAVIGQQQLAPSSVFSPARLDWPKEMSHRDIHDLISDFAAAALFAVECGFDAIEVHAGHGYLLSQWLSPRTNRRTDRFGAKRHVDRCRIVLDVCAAVRSAIGADVPLFVKVNVHDGVAGGVDFDAAIHLAQQIERQGAVDALVTSGGWVSLNGFYMLRGPVPLREMARALWNKGPANWLMALTLKVLGPLLVPALPYQPSFFREGAQRIRAHLQGTLRVCLVGGVDSLTEMRKSLADGFELVAVARPLLRDPAWLHRLVQDGDAITGQVRLCAQCGLRQASPPGPEWCHVCYGAKAIVGSAMAERRLRVGEWPLGPAQ